MLALGLAVFTFGAVRVASYMVYGEPTIVNLLYYSM